MIAPEGRKRRAFLHYPRARTQALSAAVGGGSKPQGIKEPTNPTLQEFQFGPLDNIWIEIEESERATIPRSLAYVPEIVIGLTLLIYIAVALEVNTTGLLAISGRNDNAILAENLAPVFPAEPA
jgi:hypothetical protein